MQLGITIPQTDIQGDPAIVRDFAQAAEGLGYHYLAAADHVLGVNAASRPDWGQPQHLGRLLPRPLRACSRFLAACTSTIGFSTQVMILPQRQTALVAKQAACLDVLSSGRFRFGIGIGWNPVEYVGLNESFKNRGKRSEEQVAGDAGAVGRAARDLQGRVAHASTTPASTRCPAKRAHPALVRRPRGRDPAAHRQMGRRLDHAGASAGRRRPRPTSPSSGATSTAAGRDPKSVGLEVWVSTAEGGPDDWRREFQAWKKRGVTHVTLNSTYGRGPPQAHRRAHAGRPHAAMRDYHAAVKDLL